MNKKSKTAKPAIDNKTMEKLAELEERVKRIERMIEVRGWTDKGDPQGQVND